MADFDRCKLFVGGISRDTTEFALKDHFSRYGHVSSSIIAIDRVTGFPRGFGFVSFTDSSSFDKALTDRHEILGKTVEVKKATPRGEQPHFRRSQSSISSNSTNSENQFRTKKIFVGGLCADLTAEEFKGYFEKFGRITDVVVMHDNMTNRPRGFGFITFDLEDVVEEVLKNNFHELGGKYVEVKRAIPRDPIRSMSNDQSPRMDGRAFQRGGYRQGSYLPDNLLYGYYPNHDYMSMYGYNGIYNAGYLAEFGSAGFGMPMVATASPWNGMQMARYGPILPYASPYVYHMNGVFGSVSNGANNGVGDIVVNGNLDPDGEATLVS